MINVNKRQRRAASLNRANDEDEIRIYMLRRLPSVETSVEVLYGKALLARHKC